MCGIVGYTGRREAPPILLEGLQRLVYRGYDSAGLAVSSNGTLAIRKMAGPVEDLSQDILQTPLRGVAGIGHTRWATHGAPTTLNAHPHTDCSGRIALVHNGIIENADRLRAELSASGHTFRTDTDTEVLAHLIEDAPGECLEDRVRAVIGRVKGSYGIAVVGTAEPGKIVAVRQGSPVLLGLSEGGTFVASDAAAVRSHTDEVVYLLDGDLAVITADGYQIRRGNGTIPLRRPTRVAWSADAVELAGFERYMLKEIFEQPDAIRRTIASWSARNESEDALAQCNLTPLECRTFERIQIVACGTSWHAGLIGRYILEEMTGIPVQVEYASEYRYKCQLPLPGTLTLAISQSGETADTLEALRRAQSEGSHVLGIVNTVGSTIARESDGVMYLAAGPEIGVASTKAFTSQLVALLLLGLTFGEARGALAPPRARELEGELRKLPELVRRSLEVDREIKELAKIVSNPRGFLYLGRGVSFPVALEGALKLKEVSYLHAEGYPAAEMKHGPIALVDDDTPVVFVAPRDGLYRKVLANIQEVKARGGRIIAICAEEDEEEMELARLADHRVHVPCPSDPLLTPVTTVVPLQLLAYHVAMLRGCNVDRPRNLAKSVTVE